MDSAGYVYVSDYGKNNVQVFGLSTNPHPVNSLSSKAFDVWTSQSLILCNFHNTHNESIVYAMMATLV